MINHLGILLVFHVILKQIVDQTVNFFQESHRPKYHYQELNDTMREVIVQSKTKLGLEIEIDVCIFQFLKVINGYLKFNSIQD